MDLQPLHTKIDKSIQTVHGTLVLENHVGYPRGESNLYCVSSDGRIAWHAEKPDSYTFYSRMMLGDDGSVISTYTINGHACDLDPKTGKILNQSSIQ